jgi:hypothetical protein
MTKRYIPILAVLACLSVSGGTAFATDEPPPSSPPADTTTDPATDPSTDPVTDPSADPATDDPTTDPSASPTAPACAAAPRSRVVTKSRTAVKKHMLRGTAAVAGCKADTVAKVSVSIALKHGKKCQYLTRKARLSRASTCKKPRFISATGTSSWHIRLPKHMRAGTYQILTRSVDAAGNVERAHARRLAVRRPHSTTKKK